MRPKLNTRLDEGFALGDSTPDREHSKLRARARHTLFASPTFNRIHLSIRSTRPIVRSDSHSRQQNPRTTTKHCHRNDCPSCRGGRGVRARHGHRIARTAHPPVEGEAVRPRAARSAGAEPPPGPPQTANAQTDPAPVPRLGPRLVTRVVCHVNPVHKVRTRTYLTIHYAYFALCRSVRL